MSAVDLFAGPGGWDVAARDLGIETIGIEFDHWACETRRAAGLTTIKGDVRSYGPADFPKVTGLIASSPCTPFTLAGRGVGRKALGAVTDCVKGMALEHLTRGGYDHASETYVEPAWEDARTALVLEPLRWAIEADRLGRPFEWLAFEQVPSVLPVWEAMAHALRPFGYSVATGNVQAEQYGVPQTRRRAILVARLGADVALPVPTHSRYYPRNPEKLDPGVQKWVSMAEALGWTSGPAAMRSQYNKGGELGAGNYRGIDQPAATITSKVDRNRWVMTANDQRDNAAERELDKPAPTLYFGQRANFCEWVSRPVEEQPDADSWAYTRPSTTIVGSFRPDVIAAPGYRGPGDGPRQNAPGSIKVTAEEAACLQSFPDGYPWQGGKGKRFQQIGNAIPPGLARAVLRTVVDTTDERQ